MPNNKTIQNVVEGLQRYDKLTLPSATDLIENYDKYSLKASEVAEIRRRMEELNNQTILQHDMPHDITINPLVASGRLRRLERIYGDWDTSNDQPQTTTAQEKKPVTSQNEILNLIDLHNDVATVGVCFSRKIATSDEEVSFTYTYKCDPALAATLERGTPVMLTSTETSDVRIGYVIEVHDVPNIEVDVNIGNEFQWVVAIADIQPALDAIQAEKDKLKALKVAEQKKRVRELLHEMPAEVQEMVMGSTSTAIEDNTPES